MNYDRSDVKSIMESMSVADLASLVNERDLLHALLCVVVLMEPTETTDKVMVFRACMPSLAPLFQDGDGDFLYLNVAVDRALTLVARGRL